MKVSIDILYLVMASFGVLGLIEWIKSLIAAIEKVKTDWKPIAWVGLSFALAFGVAAAADGGIYQILSNGIFILAINEIVGYNVIVKTVFALIDKLVGVLDIPAGAVNKVADVINEINPPAPVAPTETPKDEG
jgi:hypothetical protein